jgi:hypothetical protein
MLDRGEARFESLHRGTLRHLDHRQVSSVSRVASRPDGSHASFHPGSSCPA